jgi:serine/threonine protein kinase
MAVRRMLVAERYRLLEPVGAGGMGRVWLARDEMLDRDVAVKEFVPPDWMTDEEQARLRDRTLREARSAARLNHPHVVQIYDVVHAEGLPWIVMEYVPSRSLHQVINDDGPFTPVQAARIGLHVLDALTAAHRAGVLHRDIKPHNVLIGADGRVVLTDFGLATFVDDGAVTGPGLVVGSPQYVSPERARDGASTVESDLWSLGATLYAAVEGRSPYARESAMATLMALATEQPDPPRQAGPLAPVLTGLLRHEPTARLTPIEVERRLRMIIASAAADGTSAPNRSAAVPLPRGALPAPQNESPALQNDKRPPQNGNRAPQTARGASDIDVDRRRNDKVPAAAAVSMMRALPAQRTHSGPVSPAAPPIRPVDPPVADPAPQGRPRSRIIIAVLAVLAVLVGAGLLIGYLIQRDDDGNRPLVPPVGPASASASAASVGFSPVVCNGAVPKDAPHAPQKNAARGVNGWALLDGWSYFDDGSGLHMAVPDGWTYQKVRTTYCFRDPAGDRVLSLDTARNPAGDPVQACKNEAARLVREGALPGYQQITIEAKPLLNKAADWEYRYRDRDGVLLHAQTRWFATNGKAFAISWSGREIDWAGDFGKVSMVLTTFYADHPTGTRATPRAS